MLPEKSGVCVCVGAGDGEARVAAARAYASLLRPRAGGELTDTVMTVDRYGEQHYTEEARLGSVVKLVEMAEECTHGAFATHAVTWVGEQWEQNKLERLGSLMPWHEFK